MNPGNLKVKVVDIHQIAKKADAERHAVRQPMPTGPAAVRFFGDFADAGRFEHIAENVAQILGVLPKLPAREDNPQADYATDDDAGTEGPENDVGAGFDAVKGADPRAEAHGHLDVARPHAANGINGNEQGAAEEGAE